MHIHEDHCGNHSHDHEHSHTHEHTHDGVAHTHEHCHGHSHDHSHPHDHDHLHENGAHHDHSHDCSCGCESCGGKCEHTKMEELLALMTYMANHNTAHANELANLAKQLQEMGSYAAYEQVLAAVSDYEKGNLRLRAVLASLQK
ncbi:MAG: cobalt transporter [Ruminococcaceae bacterium]|nr:cobalt transporter [Oscillospiraceae bacterium]